MRKSRKEVGCCTLCGREVFEVKARYPSDHPLAGEVKSVGMPLPNAVRATLVLLSGKIVDITVCSACEITPEILPGLWRTCCMANAQEVEPDRRGAIGAGAMTPDQEEASIEGISEMAGDFPVAVVSAMPWKEFL